eukprot:COSAG02_NODE_2621_length_8402_cov_12.631218_2_plen_65_part_00
MKEFTMSELGVFLGVVGGILTSILLTVQKSKCTTIKCCGCQCDRDPTVPSTTSDSKPGKVVGKP